MRSQQPRGGRIINNGSLAAHVPRPRSAPYAATKHAITGFTKATALDGRAFDIACGQIDIGNAATSMAAGHHAGALQPNGEIAPEPLLDLAHVVDAVLYMADLPLRANVPFLTVMATTMPFLGRG
jgi:NAD(P)-dependent dehydrogenase (short-subunit alcohol dehydrogenase family)